MVPRSFNAPEADLYLFVTAKNEPYESYAAWASAC